MEQIFEIRDTGPSVLTTAITLAHASRWVVVHEAQLPQGCQSVIILIAAVSGVVIVKQNANTK